MDEFNYEFPARSDRYKTRVAIIGQITYKVLRILLSVILVASICYIAFTILPNIQQALNDFHNSNIQFQETLKEIQSTSEYTRTILDDVVQKLEPKTLELINDFINLTEKIQKYIK